MSKPHDVVAFREYTISNGEKRTESTRIGVAWLTKGGNFSVKLDFIPVDWANTNIMVMANSKKEQQPNDAIPA